MTHALTQAASGRDWQASCSEQASLQENSVAPSNPCQGLDVPTLTRAIAQGDGQAFEQLYHAIFTPLYGYLLVCARGREQEVQEALQETLIRIAHRMKPCKDSAGLWNWIRCVGRNALIDQLRPI